MSIQIIHEHDAGNGWIFDATIDQKVTVELSLAWVDYNLWSPDGSAPPASVAHAVLKFLLTQEPAQEWADRFDAARIRRRYPQSDAKIAQLIQAKSGFG